MIPDRRKPEIAPHPSDSRKVSRREALRWFLAASTPCFLTCAVAWAAAGASQREAQRIAEALRLTTGMHVADVGAGDGEWIEDLADAVGDTGHIYATEVAQDKVDRLVQAIEAGGIENATALLGGQDRSGLSPGCCDAILLRLVYHHFTDPVAMREDLRHALRPGGVIAVIDIEPQHHWRELSGVPDRGGHGIPIANLVDEMTATGFVEIGRTLDWNADEDRYCVVFRR